MPQFGVLPADVGAAAEVRTGDVGFAPVGPASGDGSGIHGVDAVHAAAANATSPHIPATQRSPIRA